MCVCVCVHVCVCVSQHVTWQSKWALQVTGATVADLTDEFSHGVVNGEDETDLAANHRLHLWDNKHWQWTDNVIKQSWLFGKVICNIVNQTQFSFLSVLICNVSLFVWTVSTTDKWNVSNMLFFQMTTYETRPDLKEKLTAFRKIYKSCTLLSFITFYYCQVYRCLFYTHCQE